MIEYKEKIYKIPEVKNLETGEILKDAYTFKQLERNDVPFPSLLDTKAVFLDHERPCKPSMVNTDDYVPLPQLVNRIFRQYTTDELLNIVQDPDGYDEDNEQIEIEDPIEQMDELQDWEDAQIAERTASAGREQSAVGGGAQDTGATTNEEAVSDGDAG